MAPELNPGATFDYKYYYSNSIIPNAAFKIRLTSTQNKHDNLPTFFHSSLSSLPLIKIEVVIVEAAYLL